MPMPLPFRIGRRKSAGNSLEEPNLTDPPPQGSFRVLERPLSSHHFSYDAPLPPIRPRTNSEMRPFSEGRSLDYQQGALYPSVNRGSAGTQLSGSSGHCETSGSSLRYSDSSTVPSTTSLTQYDEPKYNSKGPGFLKSASKALSFASKKSQLPSTEELDTAYHSTTFNNIPDPNPKLRKRATTDLSQLSEVTATPAPAHDKKKQDDWRLSIPNAGDNDDFVNMFSNQEATPRAADKRKSIEALGLAAIQHMGNMNSSQTFAPPPPLRVDGIRNASPGPVTAGSQASFDLLMANSPADDDEEDGYGYRTGHWQSARNRMDSPARNLTPDPVTALIENDSSRNNGRGSVPVLDKATKNMLRYFNSKPAGDYAPLPVTKPTEPFRSPDEEYPQHGVTLTDGDWDDSNSIQYSRQGSLRVGKPKDTITESESVIEEDLDTDLDFQEMAGVAARIEAGEKPFKEPRKIEGKVMTVAQFERYKKEKELYRSNSSAEEESDHEDDDAYDSDDEIERAKEITKQRRRQEAKMSVYRQQMQKVTGETTLPPIAASQLGHKTSMNNLRGKGKAKDNASDDEDEDIPLGILAAHGFPSKTRPPSHPSRPIHYQSDSYPRPATPQNAGHTNLPAFARHLPQDPYYGASLVNQAPREAMGYNSGSRAGSVYGGSQSGAPAVPGGLIGIIAKEEQARALRRGTAHPSFESSNAQVGFPTMMQAHPPSPGPGRNPLEMQAQMQTNQQMQQMMQMQMQWMQQMMQMQNAQLNGMPVMPMGQMPGMPGMMPPQGMMPMQGFPPNMAPNLPPANTMPQIPKIQVVNGSRPATAQGGYAASIAPSERSNIGQPSRYRPVSIAPRPGQNPYEAVNMSGAPRNNNQNQARPMSRVSMSTSNMLPQRPSSSLRKPAKEEDDEQAWEELRRKKEGRKRLWRTKKAEATEGKENVLEGVFYPADFP